MEMPQQLEFYSRSSQYARGVCREQDPSVAGATLGCWDLHLQTGAGAFGMARDFLITPNVLLYTDDYQGQVKVMGATRADTFSLAFTLNQVSGTSLYGQEPSGRAALAGFDSCVDVTFGAGQRVLIVMLDRVLLEEFMSAGQLEIPDWLGAQDRLTLSPQASATAGSVFLRLLNRSAKERIPPAALEREVLQTVAGLLRASVTPAKGAGCALPLRRRGYERALQCLEVAADMEDVRVDQLSLAAGVSQRTLEYAFREFAGCSPREYLKRRRYHKIRRNLLTAEEGSSVQDIASRQGIFEFGRMAGEYRRMFGELPSESLARRRVRENFAYSA